MTCIKLNKEASRLWKCIKINEGNNYPSDDELLQNVLDMYIGEFYGGDEDCEEKGGEK